MLRGNRRPWARVAVLGLALTGAAAPLPAAAVSIELDDVAADRIERKRRAAVGQLPLPGTPDLARLPERLQEARVSAGAAVLLRVFKATSELELWMRKDDAFVLFATYPICRWSGNLGPKLREGDRQAPEGFYTITARQLHLAGRWPRSLNLGFPNVLDRAQARDGSYILVHGGCSSSGCFAMTNPVSDEIYRLTEAALRAGQEHVPVHVFPFRMTEANLAAHQESDWQPFWRNLKQGYDSFETTRRPPRVSVCEGRYHFEDAGHGEVGAERSLAVCATTAAALEALEQSPPPAPTALSRRKAVALRENLVALRERVRSGALAVPTRLSTLAVRRGPRAPAKPPALATTPAALEALEQSPKPATDPVLWRQQAVRIRERLVALRERARSGALAVPTRLSTLAVPRGPGSPATPPALATTATSSSTPAALEALEQSPKPATDPAPWRQQAVRIRERLVALRERARSGALAVPTRLSTLAVPRGPGSPATPPALATTATSSSTPAALEALEQSPPPATDPALSWKQAVRIRETLAGFRERARSGGPAVPTRLRTLAVRRGPEAPAMPPALATTATRSSTFACSVARVSCRKFVALQEKRLAAGVPPAPPKRTFTAVRTR